LAISKWVSPKRTRSYPFARVYNTLNSTKKVTVIPVIKDEGINGDRDFIQWDTISLMSLLDVFVIFAYYESAEKSKQKITKQKFNNPYILSKLNEICNYHSSALHWNLNELNNNLHNILDKVKSSYSNIEKLTGVQLHSTTGIDNFKEKIGSDISLFMNFSRGKSLNAQSREVLTNQPKESLSTISKAKITITNYLGGQYFLTVDEIEITNNVLKLIESKHSNKSKIPSKNDIKDGLLKMILYSNLADVIINNDRIKCKAILCLTSSKIIGSISSISSNDEKLSFYNLNKFSTFQKLLMDNLFVEAKKNKFQIKLQHSK
jgi:hypothetical protein